MKKTLSKLTATVQIVIGFLFTIPFSYDILISDSAYHTIPMHIILFMIMFFIGCSFLIAGLIGISCKHISDNTSTLETDVSRMRYAAEKESAGK